MSRSCSHFLVALLVLLILAACSSKGGGGNDGGGGPPSPPPTSIVSGIVMGGVSPISESTVTLYKAGDTAGGTAASLGTVTTDTAGRFSISFATPEKSAILYLFAAGGDAGSGSNPAIQLALMLGSAGSLSSTPVTVNEVTSVAVGYAMRSFIQASGEHSIAGPPLSLENAAATTLALISPVTGVVQDTVDPDARNLIYGLANALASCVEGSASDCSTLFAQTTPPGGSAPTDSFAALLAMAENPTNNVATLWGLIGNTPPFPTMSTVPPSLSLVLNFPGGGINQPVAIAVDPDGNVWVANYRNGNGGDASVTKIPKVVDADCSSGCITFTGGGVRDPVALGADSLGNVWVVSSGRSSITIIPKGATSCSSGCITFSEGGLEFPRAITVDGSGNVWIANFGDNAGKGSVMRIPKGEVSCSSGCTTYTGGGIHQPVGIAVDPFGNVWVANGGAFGAVSFSNDPSVTEIQVGAVSDCSSGCTRFVGGGISQPVGITADSSGNVWVANRFGSGSVTQILKGASSCVLDCITFTGEDVNGPGAIAGDPSGNIWLVRAFGVTEIQAGSASDCSSGCLTFSGGGINNPRAVAVDASGNVWVANFGDSSGNSSVTEISPGALSDCSSGCTTLTGGGPNRPAGITVDSFGNVWVTNRGNKSVTKIPKGAISCASGCPTFAGGGINEPIGIAVDAADNVWVANNAPYVPSSVTMIAKGATSCPSGCTTFTGGGLSLPVRVTPDGSGNVWVSNIFGVTKISKRAAADCSSGCTAFTDGSLASPGAIAVDGSGNVWVTTVVGSVIKILENAISCPSGCTTYTGGGITNPSGIVVDGSGNVWITNVGNNTMTQIQAGAPTDCSSGCITFTAVVGPFGIAADAEGTLWVTNAYSHSVTRIKPGAATDCSSGCTSFTGGGLSIPTSIAVDDAGNVWVTNTGNGSVTKIIGSAAPTRTPMIGPPSHP